MSSTNKTATIELSQYIGTDKPTYLSDYNGDMLKIDNAIAADRDSIATAQNRAETADGKADTNKLSIDTLSAEINGDPGTPGDTGLAGDVNTLQGTVNTITSLIGTGEPTTQDKTIIGAINELAAEIPSGNVSANDVSYDNTTSGLTADDVQEALDEIAASIPSAGAVELQSGTLIAGQTSVILTFVDQPIGSTTLIDVYVEDGINYTAITTNSTTVTLAFEAQAADKAVAVRVTN